MTRRLFALLIVVLLGLSWGCTRSTRSMSPTPAHPPAFWTEVFTPTASATPAPTATPRRPCLAAQVLEGNGVQYTLSPVTAQTHRWTVQNTGTCTWEGTLILAVAPGSGFPITRFLRLGSPVAPNQTLKVEVAFRAPRETGVYQGRWGLMTKDGRVIPLANGPLQFTVVVPTPTPIPSPTPFRGALLFTYRTVTLTPHQQLNFDEGTPEVEYTYNGENDQQLLHVGDHVFFLRTYEWPPLFDTCYYAHYDGKTNAIHNPHQKLGWVFCFTTNEKRVGALVIQNYFKQGGKPRLVITLLTWAPKNRKLP